MTNIPVHRLIDAENGLIDRGIFTSQDIFEEEQERIFTRAWLFIGHESQIPVPGDFVSTRMGTEPVILCRDREGNIREMISRGAGFVHVSPRQHGDPQGERAPRAARARDHRATGDAHACRAPGAVGGRAGGGLR